MAMHFLFPLTLLCVCVCMCVLCVVCCVCMCVYVYVCMCMSTGNAIIAELLRLSDNVPSVFTLEDANDREKYSVLLFDFAYLRNSEDYEARIESNADWIELDEDFRDNHLPILDRFYTLFESIYKYITDFNKYLADMDEGIFIQHTFEGVLLNQDGKQLLAEAVYLFGVCVCVCVCVCLCVCVCTSIYSYTSPHLYSYTLTHTYTHTHTHRCYAYASRYTY